MKATPVGVAKKVWAALGDVDNYVAAMKATPVGVAKAGTHDVGRPTGQDAAMKATPSAWRRRVSYWRGANFTTAAMKATPVGVAKRLDMSDRIGVKRPQ